MGIKVIGCVLKRNRLRWFGHVERKEKKEDWVRKCMYMEVEGARTRGRTRKTWLEVVRNDRMELGLASVDALDCHVWNRKTVGNTC